MLDDLKKNSFIEENTFFNTEKGLIIYADSHRAMQEVDSESIDLIVTSPPFGLVRKKDYGNVDASDYVRWFKKFGESFKRILKKNGSLVIDIGGSWKSGQPTRSLYHFKLLIMLCDDLGFHLAQDFYWWNPSKLPTPAEWVNVRRIRVKDAVNCVWWLSPTPWPKASNRRVLLPYSKSMQDLFDRGYKAQKRPSGHDISNNFKKNNNASIPSNLIAIANTESNSFYLRYCKEKNIKPHPARFPSDLPEFFIRMLTNQGDVILDPFAGSCVTGEVCEKLNRKWICIDNVKEYLEGSVCRFMYKGGKDHSNGSNLYHKIPRPSAMWNNLPHDDISDNGGKTR